MNALPEWKKVYQTVSDYSQTVTLDIVENILQLSKNDLIRGLLIYNPYSIEGFHQWAAESEIDDVKKQFINELAVNFNIEAKVMYSIVCNFLMYEYFGKIDEFWEKTTGPRRQSRLKIFIFSYLTSERMFLLKTLRYIFENVANADFKFQQCFETFVRSIPLDELQHNLWCMYEMLQAEYLYDHLQNDEGYQKLWTSRLHREQCEILMILGLTTEQNKMSYDLIQNLLRLSIENPNSSQGNYLSLTIEEKDALELDKIKFGLFFILIDHIWERENLREFFQSERSIHFQESLLIKIENPKCRLLLLTWLIAKLRVISLTTNEDRLFAESIYVYEPFIVLREIVAYPNYQKTGFGNLVLFACHKVFDQICLSFGKTPVLFKKNTIPLLCEFLKNPALTSKCMQTRGGMDKLIELSLETFPYNFHEFTKIAQTLLSVPTECEKAINLIKEMPSFLSNRKWTGKGDLVHHLKKRQSAYPDSDLIVFDVDTEIISYEWDEAHYARYMGKFSYIKHLEYELTRMVDKAKATHQYDKALMRKVIQGFRVIMQMIRYCRDSDLLLACGVYEIVQKMETILANSDGTMMEPDLIRLYFDVHNHLQLYQGTNMFMLCDQIVWRVFALKFKDNDGNEFNMADMLFNEDIFEQSVMITLLKEEQVSDDHSMLITYLETLLNGIQFFDDEINFFHKKMQLTGVAYIFNSVFLPHLNWRYKDIAKRDKITMCCLSIFHNMLQRNVEEMNAQEKEVYDLCYHALLENEYIVEGFIRLFNSDKYDLMHAMECESNWDTGVVNEKFNVIRMKIALSLLLMKLNNKREDGASAFGKSVKFLLKPIIIYFTNNYNVTIAELSCRFLEKIAENEDISLLSLLEFDHYQVQSIFLEKLRDPLEDDRIKISIIDLINTCISTQNGMTAAFFNLKCYMNYESTAEASTTSTDDTIGDSVVNFMVDYLKNIKKSHDFFKNPIQLGILRLMINIWANNRNNLLDEISKSKNFWAIMFDPFYCDFKQNMEVYASILKIVKYEIERKGSADDNLMASIRKLICDKDNLKKWHDYIVCTLNNTVSYSPELIPNWSEFLVLIQQIMPANEISDEIKRSLVTCSLTGMCVPFVLYNNAEMVLQWTQLYAVIMGLWKFSDEEFADIIERLGTFFHSVANYFRYFQPHVRQLIISIGLKTVAGNLDYFVANPTNLLDFVNPMGTIFDWEYENFMGYVAQLETETDRVEQTKPWLLCITLATYLLELPIVDRLDIWFIYREALRKVINTTRPLVEKRATLPFGKLAIKFAIFYAKTSMANEFLSINLLKFYNEIRPVVFCPTLGEAIANGLSAEVKEWWIIILGLLRLNRTLIAKLKGRILDTCVQFIEQQNYALGQALQLLKFTVDMTAMELILETLRFAYDLIGARYFSLDYATIAYLMQGTKLTMNAAILALLGSQKIQFYEINGIQMESCATPPTGFFTVVLNKLLEIMYWASNCMIVTKPKLEEILSTILQHADIQLMISNSFSVTQFQLPISNEITFGTLLCLGHYLCKALNFTSADAPPLDAETLERLISEHSMDEYENKCDLGLLDLINQQDLAQIIEYTTLTSNKYTGFIIYLDPELEVQGEKLTNFLHYETGDYVAKSIMAISKLNLGLVRTTLETLLVFLASEVLPLSLLYAEENFSAFKREFSAEMQFLYEFVRKKTAEEFQALALIPSPRVQTANVDAITKYLLTLLGTQEPPIDEKNFLLVISQWLIKFCD